MKFYIDIILRVILALNIVGLLLGLTLWEKNKIFDKIGVFSCCVLAGFGLVEAILTVIFGF